MHEWQSLSHVRWECKSHIVIIPKYRRGASIRARPPRGAFLKPRPIGEVDYSIGSDRTRQNPTRTDKDEQQSGSRVGGDGDSPARHAPPRRVTIGR